MYTPAFTVFFLLIVGSLWCLFVAAVHKAGHRAWVAAVGAAAWLGITAGVAALGWLTPTTTPLMLGSIVLVSVALVASPVGRSLAALPLPALVGFQAFRVAVEVMLHWAFLNGIIPIQMSWEANNQDVWSGLTAALLSLWLLWGTPPRWALWTWGVGGLLLLANIVGVSVLSTPAFAFFDARPLNTWIFQAPWVWLPTAMVMSALIGHLLLFRRLWSDRVQAA